MSVLIREKVAALISCEGWEEEEGWISCEGNSSADIM
jgi:hypothetical protein